MECPYNEMLEPKELYLLNYTLDCEPNFAASSIQFLNVPFQAFF
jgi:hypothetical protein